MLQRKIENQKTKINKILEEKQHITRDQYQNILSQINKDIQKHVTNFIKKPLKCVAVFDFDCFFCQCEQLINPDLATVPFAVIGGSIVNTSNYKAREYGVRSAMPVQIAKHLCSELVIKQSNYKLYSEISKKAGKIFQYYDQNAQQLSIDEYSIDITQQVNQMIERNIQLSRDQYVNYLEIDDDQYSIYASYIINKIKERILNELKITVTAGVSFNTQIAKMVCDFRKPNGQTVTKLRFKDCNDYLNWFQRTIFKQNIRKIWGIGSAGEYTLSQTLNIETIGDLFKQRGYIILLFTKSVHELIYASIGLQNLFDEEYIQKTRGIERTFTDTGDMNIINQITKSVCLKICHQLMDRNQEAKRVQLKIRFADWTDVMHITNLKYQTNNFDQFYYIVRQEIKKIIENKIQISHGKSVQTGFDANQIETPSWFVRLIGIRACELVNLDVDDKNSLSQSFSEEDQQQSKQDIFKQKCVQQKQILQNNNDTQKCQYCGLRFPIINIEQHEQRCTKNIYLIYQNKMKQKSKKGTIDSFLLKQKQKKFRK